MDKKDTIDIQHSILKQAEKVLYYNTLLIEQCDSWLPAEEGNRYMEKRIAERRKKKHGGDLRDQPTIKNALKS